MPKSGPSRSTITGTEEAPQIIGIGANAPFPELKEKMALFGQFIGDWEITECRIVNKDGSEVKQKGQIHFGWIMEGRAIQDVWMVIDPKNGRAVPIGTTIRFFDPKIEAWRSTWISPVQGVVQTFIGRSVGDDIVLESKTKNGDPEKWIFSQIKPESFRWHAEESIDGGRTWNVTEEMMIRRV